MDQRTKRLFFSIVAVIMALSVIELGARAVSTLWPPATTVSGIEGDSCYQFDPFLAYRFIPDSLYEGKLRIGPDGFISNRSDTASAISVGKPANVFRIIMLGGSTVAGSRASCNEATIPAQLELLLNSDTRATEKCEVINAGVGGYTAYQEFAYYTSSLYRYQPDLVIFYDGFNDAAYALDWGGYADAWSATHAPQNFQRYALQLQRGVPPLTDGTPRLLNVANLCATTRLLDRLLNRNRSAVEPLRPSPDEAAALYLAQVQQRLAYSRGQNLPLLSVLQPVLIHKPVLTAEEQAIPRAMLLSHEALAAYYVAVQRSAPRDSIVDLTTVFANEGQTRFLDVCHLNDAGNRAMAEQLREQALRLRFSRRDGQ